MKAVILSLCSLLLSLSAFAAVEMKDASFVCRLGDQVKADGTYVCKLPTARFKLVNGGKSTFYSAFVSAKKTGRYNEVADGYCVALGFAAAVTYRASTTAEYAEADLYEVTGYNSVASFTSFGKLADVEMMSDMTEDHPAIIFDLICK